MIEVLGTCDCHDGWHTFRNDPDPCYGWWDGSEEETENN